MASGKRRGHKPSASSGQGAAPPAAPLAAALSHLAGVAGVTVFSESEYAEYLLNGTLGPKDVLRPCRWNNVVLEALAYQDPDEAPLDEDNLSILDIAPHLVPPNGLFGCGLSCEDEFVGSLEEVEEHERTCNQLLAFFPVDLWRDAGDPAEMALPKETVFKVLHRPLYELQRVRRDEVAAASFAGAVIVAWWKKLRHPLKDLKDLDKLGTVTIDLAPPPVEPVDKVVQEPMEALNQLDGDAGDFILEADPAAVPLSLNSPSSTGSRKSLPLRSPLSIHQLRIVFNTTSNDEGQGNDTMQVQGDRADGVQEGGGGFGIQFDNGEHTLVPDTGDIW